MPEHIYHHYHNLLCAYYYQPIDIRTDGSMDSVLRDVVGLTSVAEYMGSMRVVALPIDNALIKQGQQLWYAIARTPWSWADLAVRVRSELVFREAIVHLVGQWPLLLEQAAQTATGLLSGQENAGLINTHPAGVNHNDLDTYGLSHAPQNPPSTLHPPNNAQTVITTLRPAIRQLVHAKHTALDDEKRAIEVRIMGHYPLHLHRNGGPNGDPAITSNVAAGRTMRGRGNPTRAGSYAADILAWMALNLFRHWLGQHMSGDQNRHCASDGGAGFYRALHAGGTAYIDHASLNNFCIYFPLSAKSRATFEEQMGLLKESVRPFVIPLVKCNLALEKAGAEALAYLTCAEVGREDLPWIGGRAEIPWETAGMVGALDEVAESAGASGGGGLAQRHRLGGAMDLGGQGHVYAPAHAYTHGQEKSKGKEKRKSAAAAAPNTASGNEPTVPSPNKRTRQPSSTSPSPSYSGGRTQHQPEDVTSPQKRARKDKSNDTRGMISSHLYGDNRPGSSKSKSQGREQGQGHGKSKSRATPLDQFVAGATTTTGPGDRVVTGPTASTTNTATTSESARLQKIHDDLQAQYNLDSDDDRSGGNSGSPGRANVSGNFDGAPGGSAGARSGKNDRGRRETKVFDDEDISSILRDGDTGDVEALSLALGGTPTRPHQHRRPHSSHRHQNQPQSQGGARQRNSNLGSQYYVAEDEREGGQSGSGRMGGKNVPGRRLDDEEGLFGEGEDGDGGDEDEGEEYEGDGEEGEEDEDGDGEEGEEAEEGSSGLFVST